VRLASSYVPALSNDAIIIYDNTSDPGIWCGAQHIASQLQRSLHIDWPFKNSWIKLLIL
jgi:hypothetical protein